jgi:hypothetical protein
MATFKSKMKYLESDWADRIWEGASSMNGGQGAAWRLGLAALAITGARPASLARGIRFSVVVDHEGITWLRADIPGAKIIRGPDGAAVRGQDRVQIAWCLTETEDAPGQLPERGAEFTAIVHELRRHHPAFFSGSIVIQYDADSIATSVRDLSKRIWPRKKHHVSPICYRERFSAHAKSLGMPPEEIAAAMGHLSTESQCRYQSAYRGKSKGKVSRAPLFDKVKAPQAVKTARSPMIRFKKMAARKALALQG